MAVVFLGLGSNVDRARNIHFALTELAKAFGEVQLSPVYESESVGFEGSDFINLVVKVETELDVAALVELLRDIENRAGRDRSLPKFSPRTLDIDVLLVGDLVGVHGGITLPRDEILKNAFVLLPLSEMYPEGKHPETGETYTALWDSFDKEKQKLWRVELKPQT